MKNFKKIIPGAFVALLTIGLVLQAPAQTDPLENPLNEELVEGVVMEIIEEHEEETFNGIGYVQTLELEIENDAGEGETVILETDALSLINAGQYEIGDKLVILKQELAPGEASYYVIEYVRHDSLLWLFILFVGVVILVAKWQGIRSILGMVFSFIVLFTLILPQLLAGTSPILIVILGACLIIPVTFYLSHGINRKTSVAVVGTLITLVITGILASAWVSIAHLTGVASEEAAFLKLDTGETINFHGLLLAGILISLLGILDDITISQSSIVHQLRETKKKISFSELYSRAISVGRDHIASMVNTLVLVYTGASLPLLLLFMIGSQTFSEVLNYEFIAEEVIQTLVASIGLILAVPITTLLACLAREK